MEPNHSSDLYGIQLFAVWAELKLLALERAQLFRLGFA
jgi:hypothetical protein